MKLDIKKVPFTKYGSYMAISDLSSEFCLFGRPLNLKGGLYLRTIRGDTMMQPIVCRLLPTEYGDVVEYEYETDEAVLSIVTKQGRIRITFADEKTLLIEGKGEGVGIRLDEIEFGGVFDYVHEILYKGQIYYEMNLYKNQNKFLCATQTGNVSMRQNWQEKTASECIVDFKSEKGRFLALIEEEKCEWSQRDFCFDFEQCVEHNRGELRTFTSKLPTVPADFEEERKQAGYVLWANTVQKEAFLTRDAVYASNNWMLGAFSWDQCFPAMALAYGNPDLAWDQLMIMFDYQDSSGRIPDHVTDIESTWNYCKPPIHGWTLMRMMKHMELSRVQKEEAYERLGKWTQWWYEYRNVDNSGNCTYFHGNDSGWDNATVFRISPTVVTPDLSAFLIIQMEMLSQLAKDLGKTGEMKAWKERSEKQLRDMLSYSFRDGEPISHIMRTGEVVENGCLLPYLSLILGKRLPEKNRKLMINALRNSGFLTEHGIATEKVTSEFYNPDGYWRGPIWAPSTLIVLDGLYQSGETELVKNLAKRFANLVRKSGFAENFDALSGEGRRDRAYSWTAAIMNP